MVQPPPMTPGEREELTQYPYQENPEHYQRRMWSRTLPMFLACLRCGAAVWDPARHDEWHEHA